MKKPKISKEWLAKNPGVWVLLEETCKKVHLSKRKKISMSTARNWLRALTLKRKQALCSDGKYHAVITDEVEAAFLNVYRTKLAFKVSK